MIEEITLGRRRIDMLFVSTHDMVGVEIKGPKDKLDERMTGQLREYLFYVPEVWLVVDKKFQDKEAFRRVGYDVNRAVFVDGEIVVSNIDRDPARDEMCCSRILERLWSGEAFRIATRKGLLHPQFKGGRQKILKILARMLTGHEIMTEVCAELRARPLVGMASDVPVGDRVPPPKGMIHV